MIAREFVMPGSRWVTGLGPGCFGLNFWRLSSDRMLLAATLLV